MEKDFSQFEKRQDVIDDSGSKDAVAVIVKRDTEGVDSSDDTIVAETGMNEDVDSTSTYGNDDADLVHFTKQILDFGREANLPVEILLFPRRCGVDACPQTLDAEFGTMDRH